LFFTGLRFFLTALILVFALRPLRGQMRHMFGIAMTMGVAHFAFLYLGIKLAGGVSAVAVTVQLIAPFSLLLAVVVLKEQTSPGRLIGVAVAFGGVIVLGFDPVVLDQINGVLLVVISAFSAAIGLVLMRLLRPVGVYAMQGWTGAMSAPPLLLLSFLIEDGQIDALMNIDLHGLGALAFIVLGTTVVAHGGWYYLLRLYPVSTLTPYGLLAPVFGVCFAVLIFDETLSIRFLVGAMMTVTGVAITHFAKKPATPT
ncbi:MAG: EamA family transporter, partial [Rhodospirillales bacterium]|nr:EamA family transporter [Rhodospirillales bacterium]